MDKLSTIGFLYKVEGVQLQPSDNGLQVTDSFITRDIIDGINAKLKEKNFKVEETSLRPKYVNNELYLEGFAREIREPKTVGFFSDKQ
jgi:hypothetical protein